MENLEEQVREWVMEPTFISSGNTLDLFLTLEIDHVGVVKVLAPFPRCGHCPVVVNIFLILIWMLKVVRRLQSTTCGTEVIMWDCQLH